MPDYICKNMVSCFATDKPTQTQHCFEVLVQEEVSHDAVRKKKAMQLKAWNVGTVFLNLL